MASSKLFDLRKKEGRREYQHPSWWTEWKGLTYEFVKACTVERLYDDPNRLHPQRVIAKEAIK